MAKQTRTKRFFSVFFQPKQWFDFERVKAQTDALADTISRMFTVTKKDNVESFDEAMRRMNVTEDDLKARKRVFLRLSYLMGAVSLLVFAYTMYHLLYAQYVAVMLSTVIFFICLSLTFRYHYWYFQLHKRQLACSIRAWFKEGVLGEKA